MCDSSGCEKEATHILTWASEEGTLLFEVKLCLDHFNEFLLMSKLDVSMTEYGKKIIESSSVED